eukprot:6074249-Amphidinium_carterae.1
MGEVTPAAGSRAFVGPSCLTSVNERERDGMKASRELRQQLGDDHTAMSAAVACGGNAVMAAFTHQTMDDGDQAIDDRPELIVHHQAAQDFVVAANVTGEATI